MIEEIIKSPKNSFCCSALEYFQNEVKITGYTIEMVLMVKGEHKRLIYPVIDTWKLKKYLKEIGERCMDKLLVPRNMKKIIIKKEKNNIIVCSDKISICLPESMAVLLDCGNFMMDEIAVSFLKDISKIFPNRKIGMKISFGKPVGEAEVWL